MPPAASSRRLRGLVIPGLANAHSHAFHRALRSRTQRDRGSFWTWRKLMYDAAGQLTPERYRALATAVYAEMALAGITAVGEFHYLHHDVGGRRYADPNEMGKALIAAAADAGVRLTLLDTCYLRSGLDGAPLADGPQRRFGDGTATAWAERVDGLRTRRRITRAGNRRCRNTFRAGGATGRDDRGGRVGRHPSRTAARALVRADGRGRRVHRGAQLHPDRAAARQRSPRAPHHRGARHPPDRTGHRGHGPHGDRRLLLPDHRT